MERTDQIIELISKANQSFDSGVIRDGQKLTREALKLVKIQGKIPNKKFTIPQIKNCIDKDLKKSTSKNSKVTPITIDVSPQLVRIIANCLCKKEISIVFLLITKI